MSQRDNTDRAGIRVKAVANPASSDFAHPAAHTKCCNKTSTDEKKIKAFSLAMKQAKFGSMGGDEESSVDVVVERKWPRLYRASGGSGALACLSELSSQDNEVSLSLILQTRFDPIGGFFTVNQTASALVKDV